MSRATKARISIFLIAVGAFFLLASTAGAQSCGSSSPTCLLGDVSIGGLPASTGCPSTVQVTSRWAQIGSPKVGCSFSCVMNTLDNAYVHPGKCVTSTIGSPASSLSATLTVTFSATDKNYHYVGILTTVIEADGITIVTYNSPTVGTQCST